MIKLLILLAGLLPLSIFGFINGAKYIIQEPLNLLAGVLFIIATYLMFYITKDFKELFKKMNIIPDSPLWHLSQTPLLKIITVMIILTLAIGNIVSGLKTPGYARYNYDLIMGILLGVITVVFLRLKPK